MNNNQNDQALRILKQWTIEDSRGVKHPVTLMQSDHPLTHLVSRAPKPGNWIPCTPGSVAPVTKPKPQPVPDIPVETASLTWEYRLPRAKKR